MPTTDEIRAAIREGTWPRVGLAADVQRLLEELDAANAKLHMVRLIIESLNMTDRGTGHNHQPGDEHEDCAGCWAESIKRALEEDQ